MSLVSSNNPKAGEKQTSNQSAANNNGTGNGGGANSTNSQTHPEEASEDQARRIRRLVDEGMSEKLASEEVLGKGWAAP